MFQYTLDTNNNSARTVDQHFGSLPVQTSKKLNKNSLNTIHNSLELKSISLNDLLHTMHKRGKENKTINPEANKDELFKVFFESFELSEIEPNLEDNTQWIKTYQNIYKGLIAQSLTVHCLKVINSIDGNLNKVIKAKEEYEIGNIEILHRTAIYWLIAIGTIIGVVLSEAFLFSLPILGAFSIPIIIATLIILPILSMRFVPHFINRNVEQQQEKIEKAEKIFAPVQEELNKVKNSFNINEKKDLYLQILTAKNEEMKARQNVNSIKPDENPDTFQDKFNEATAKHDDALLKMKDLKHKFFGASEESNEQEDIESLLNKI